MLNTKQKTLGSVLFRRVTDSNPNARMHRAINKANNDVSLCVMPYDTQHLAHDRNMLR